MKKRITILILLISVTLLVSAQSFKDLQITGLKDAEILKTDEKGNVVSSEICQAKIRSIDTLNSAIAVYPLKNMEFYGQNRTELAAIFSTNSPDVEKAEDLKITLNLKKQAKLLYYPTEKGQVTYSESKDVFEGANDITNYVFKNHLINNGETVDETWLSQGHKKFEILILFDTIVTSDYIRYDLSKLLTVEKKTNRSICDRVNENTEKIKNTKTIYNSSGELSGFERGRYIKTYKNVYVPNVVIDAYSKRRYPTVFFLGRKFSENEYRSFIENVLTKKGLNDLFYLSDEENRRKSGLNIGEGVRLIDINPNGYANSCSGSTVGLGGGTFALENFTQSYKKDGIINNTISGNSQGVDIFSSKISSNNEDSSMQYSFTPDRFMIKSRSGRDSVLFLDDKNKKYLLYAKNKDLTHSNSIVTRGLLDSLLNKKLSAETDPVFTAWDKDYNDLTHKPTPPTGLEKITENGMSGWRLVGMNPDMYGDIGNGAVDLSIGTTTSTTKGATGSNAFASGIDVTASGDGSFSSGQDAIASNILAFARGLNVTASGQVSFVAGVLSEAQGKTSVAFGESVTASGDYSFSANRYTQSQSYAETVFGQYNTIYAPTSVTSWKSNDRLFVVGNGTGPGTRSDALVVYKNGSIDINGVMKLKPTTAPTTPERGMVYFDSADNHLKYYNGTAWISL